jgi:hypothetical protein
MDRFTAKVVADLTGKESLRPYTYMVGIDLFELELRMALRAEKYKKGCIPKTELEYYKDVCSSINDVMVEDILSYRFKEYRTLWSAFTAAKPAYNEELFRQMYLGQWS